MVRRWRPVGVALCVLGMLSAGGCGPKRVPAGGTVELDGQPLEAGILYFNPDTAKGNTARVSCTSAVKNGRFELRTDGIERSDSGTGVPLGWYKVTVRVNEPGEKPTFPGPAYEINPKYLDVNLTPIEIEVVENPEPGRYDIKLTK
jgi:hypothetical protein